MGKTNTAQKDKFIELRATGLSYADIAKQIGVAKQTVCKWGKDFQLDVENAKTLHLDAIYQKYVIAKDKQIESFGKQLDNVLAELDDRDLSNVPTDRLFKIAFDLSDRLKAEAEPLQLREKTGRIKPAFDFDFQAEVEEIDSWNI
jgi:DNA-binding XRE family transcriptional regulator